MTFHRTFPLNLPAIAQVLKLSVLRDGRVSGSDLRECTTLGTIYIEAMPRYARGSGLLEMDSFRPTVLGRLVYERDPDLRDETTFWVMHYHLSAPQGPGPAYWSRFVTRDLPFAESVAVEDLDRDLRQFLAGQPGAGSLADRTVKSSITVFVGSYTKADALGHLGFLSTEGKGENQRVIVSEPTEPPVGVVAYALADYWDANYADRVTMDLNVLLREEGFARVLWTDARHLEAALDALRVRGVIDILRAAPPFQVTRLWPNPAALLDRLYE